MRAIVSHYLVFSSHFSKMAANWEYLLSATFSVKLLQKIWSFVLWAVSIDETSMEKTQESMLKVH